MYPSAATAGLIRALAKERALLWCLLASFALHALVLLGMPRHEAPASPSRTQLALTARLVPFAAAEPAPVPAPQPESAPPPERARRQVSKSAPAPRPALAQPLPSPAPAAPASAPAPAKAVPAASAPASPGAADSPAQPPAAALARVPSQARARIPGEAAKLAQEADKRTLAQYRLDLIVATRRYTRYPAIAKEKGWQGRVEVHMVIAASGMLASALVKTSSGHEILDNQALDMLKKGKDTVPVPAVLRGRAFGIDVPVIFDLNQQSS